MKNRVTIDDLISSRSSEIFDIQPDNKTGKLRVIKKQQRLEHYDNESELKKEAIEKVLCRIPKSLILKTDNMALRIGNGRKTKTRNPGMSDHHLCVNGFFVAIEAKMPGKDLDKDQIAYRVKVLKSNGIFIVYHSLYELVEELKQNRLVSRDFEAI